MIDFASFMVFVPTFFVVSISPGMCMTLAMTMGMTVGIRKTLWMTVGELIGVGLVGLAAVIGVATMMLKYPAVFMVFKYVGGAYLFYVGVQMWRSKGKMAVVEGEQAGLDKSGAEFALQGFVTAIANPKGWAFMVSLLPPFINPQLAMMPQLTILLVTILVIEFMCLMIYANGGKQLGKILQKSNNVKMLNKISGTLMMFVGVWLALG